jgi:hypothetical protein
MTTQVVRSVITITFIQPRMNKLIVHPRSMARRRVDLDQRSSAPPRPGNGDNTPERSSGRRFMSVQAGARRALNEILGAEDRTHAERAIQALVTDYGAKWPKAVAKVVDHQEALLTFLAYPAEHWLHLRTTDESFKAGVALSAGWDGVSLLGGRGRPRSEEQGLGAGSPAAQLAP